MKHPFCQLITVIMLLKATNQQCTSDRLETLNATCPNKWQLDMSNETTFSFPVNEPFLVHQRLTRFICNNCLVHKIYKESLSKVTSLAHLELRHNNLTYIHRDAFKHNPNLENLFLSNNLLKLFNPEGTLHFLSKLVGIDLSFNVDFDVNKVEIHMKSLITFTCQNCGTTILTEATMSKMPKLINLSMPHNQLEHIEENAFVTSRLMTINIDSNKQLQRLKIHSSTLKNLSAQHCNLDGTLDTSTMPALTEINVRGNHLTHLNEHGFEKNPNISVILLDENEIQKIPWKFLNFPLIQLRVLCLDRNPLQPFEFVGDVTQNYKRRKLRNGCLDDSSEYKQFEAFLPNHHGVALYKKYSLLAIDRNASKVDLSNKNIVVIEKDYFEELTNVEKLQFDNNVKFNFKQSQTFIRSTSITHLSIQNCSITAIDIETFQQLPNLQFIDLEGNQIKSLTNKLFQNNAKLKWLSLNRNKIQILYYRVFENHEQLQTLRLDWNKQLTNIPDIPFLVSYSLEELNCNHCGFSNLDDATVSALPNLRKLELTNNEIRTIDPGTFKSNTKLKKVNLRGNDLKSFDPTSLELPPLISQLCFGETSAIAADHVTKETIERMIELQNGCDDEVTLRKLYGVYNATAEQDSSINTQSGSSTVPSQLVGVILIAMAVVRNC